MPNNKRKKNLTPEQCRRLIQGILLGSSEVNGVRRPARGAITKQAEEFGLSRVQVSRLWKKALKNFADSGMYRCSPTKKGNSGRVRTYDPTELAEALEELPSEKRGSMRSIAEALGISLGLVHKLTKDDNVILPHTNSIRAELTEQNKLCRQMYAIDRIIEVNGEKVYNDAYGEIHVNEKWFFISQTSQRIYLSQLEAEQD